MRKATLTYLALFSLTLASAVYAMKAPSSAVMTTKASLQQQLETRKQALDAI